MVQSLVVTRLADVQALREERRWAEALERLEGLTPYLVSANKAGIEVDTSGVEPLRAALIADAMAGYKASAEAALGAGSWAAAIVRLEAYEALSPGEPEVRSGMALARRRWAAEELEQGAVRSAADRLARSAAVGGDGSVDDGRWAAGAYAAMGRSALERGACRAALVDLESARSLGGEVSAGIKRATECARTGVVLRVDGVGRTPDALEQALLALLLERGSRHLRPDTEKAGLPTRTLPEGPEGPPISAGPYSLSVSTSVPTIQSSAPRRRVRQSRSGRGRCVDPFGSPWPGPCHAEVYVNYEELEEELLGVLSVVLVIVDTQKPESTLIRIPVRVTERDVVRWRGEVLSVVAVGTPGVTTTSWPQKPGGSAARAKKAREEAREGLAGRLALVMAERLASTAIGVIDLEPAVPDRAGELPPIGGVPR